VVKKPYPEAIRKEGMVALGKIVFTSREHVIALEPRGKGLLGITLRYPYEVRKEDEYFEDIPDEKIPKDMLELASHIERFCCVPSRLAQGPKTRRC
jgi:DNA end-binding protein Ku